MNSTIQSPRRERRSSDQAQPIKLKQYINLPRRKRAIYDREIPAVLFDEMNAIDDALSDDDGVRIDWPEGRPKYQDVIRPKTDDELFAGRICVLTDEIAIDFRDDASGLVAQYLERIAERLQATAKRVRAAKRK